MQDLLPDWMWSVWEEEGPRRTTKGKQFGREYPEFSFGYTKFDKSTNHLGEDVEKLDLQVRESVLENIYRRF